MWVDPRILGLEVGKVASHHGDELRGVLEGVDADERSVATCFDMMQGASLDGLGPFDVPPEFGFRAVTTARCEARVTACSPNGSARDEV